MMNVSIHFVQPVFRFIVHRGLEETKLDGAALKRNQMSDEGDVCHDVLSRESRPTVYFIFKSGQVRSDFGERGSV